MVLVTGASTGIGLALARRLRDDTDHHLILTARESSLPRFGEHGIEENERVWLRRLDVTDAAQRREVVREAMRRCGGVDVLVNNAGVSYRSVTEHVSDSERIAQMDVNFQAPMALSRLCLPAMRARRWGRIVNVSSVGGMMAMPTMSAYSASKFALEGASEALWYEVRPWNIRVTLVQPGFVNSSSFENTRYTHGSAWASTHDHAAYHEHYETMAPFIERLMRRSPTTPEVIARRMLRVLEARRPPLRLPVTPDAWAFSMLRRLLPRRLYHALLYRSLPGVRAWGRQPRAVPPPRPGVAAKALPGRLRA